MDPAFDPYLELLGIPKEEQPPNCYRLLGIPEFTSNKQVIANGAARQMQFLRRVGGDQYLNDVQRILTEISRVRIILLDDAKRADYDKTLRAKERASRNGNSADTGSELRSESQFDLSAPTIRDATGHVSTIQLIHLSGPKVGQVVSFRSREVSIGPSSKFDLMVPTRNSSQFKLEHEIDQWSISSEDTGFAVNGSLVNGLAILKDGDIIRLSVDGPDLQFIQEVDLTRHLESLGQYEDVVQNVRVAAESEPGGTSAQRQPLATGSFKQHASSPAAGNPQSRSHQSTGRPANSTSNPGQRAATPTSPLNQSQRAKPSNSKLVKLPKSQQPKGVAKSVKDVANKALGREAKYTKKKGLAFDWQMCVFWLAVGCVIAAIAAGILFGWRSAS